MLERRRGIVHNLTMDLTLIQQLAICAIPLLFAITLHEVAHGWVASWCGDQTARLSGRLSVNPIHHIDPVGTIIVPLLTLFTTKMIFGWAKPVPVDERNMRHPRRDMALVAGAGPLANLLMAIFWAGVLRFGLYLNTVDADWLGVPLGFMGMFGIKINIWLGLLNLIPLPPLDGGRLMTSLLPPRLGYQLSRVEPYSFVILILLLVSGWLSLILFPAAAFMTRLVGSLFGL